MNKFVLDEGYLQFEFLGYDSAVKFDDSGTNPHGLRPVDFGIESQNLFCKSKIWL